MKKFEPLGEGRYALPIRLSYINAKGQEAVLDDDEGSFAHELRGREGFEFPTIKLTEHNYGDGSTDIAAISVKNRQVTCFFWADVMDVPNWEEKFNEVKSILLQTGQKDGDWGKLKIRTREGNYVFLDCVYEKGFDNIVRDIDMRMKFSLTFRATSPYFYNGFTNTVTLGQSDEAGYMYLNDAVLCSTAAEARNISGWTSDVPSTETAKYYWKVSSNPVLYYAIKKDTTLMMDEAELMDTSGEAKKYSGDSTNSTALMKWWSVTRNGTTMYYAISQDSLYMRSADYSSTEDLYIQGERVYPKIIINGPAENISIKSVTTGRKIDISAGNKVKLDTNERIQIETAPLKRYIKMKKTGGKWTSILQYLSADSTLDFPLEHGVNDITFNNSAGSPQTFLRFTFTERRAGLQ